MKDDKSDEAIQPYQFRMNRPKRETYKFSNLGISALVISKFWNHSDHDQSSSKFSNLIENLYMNDEVEDKKVFKNTDDNPSSKDSQERSLQFRRRSGAALSISLKFHVFFNILSTKNSGIEFYKLRNLSWLWKWNNKVQLLRWPDRSISSRHWQ